MDISQLLGRATSAVGITNQATDKEPDKSEATRLVNALTSELTAANMMNLQLSEALKNLNQELRHQDEFEKEKARYKLVETPQGDFIFRLIEEKANGQPIHDICPVCLNRDQLISFVSGKEDKKVCQTDQSHSFMFSEESPIHRRPRIK